MKRLLSLLLACMMLAVYFHGGWVCPSVAFCHQPCPLCGCTRDFIDIYKGNWVMRNSLSLWLFFLTHAELAWRIVFSFATSRKGLAMADAIIHGAIAVPLAVYLAATNQLWKQIIL